MEKQLDVILSVDWEGVSLEKSNLNRLCQFKKNFDLPLVHYFNPAYFTAPDIQFSNAEVMKVFSVEDEIALHLHAPRHFVEDSGVTFKSAPCFSSQGDQHCGEFFGQEVMLHSYSENEFGQLVQHSLKLFEEHGFDSPKSFRAGGWMLAPDQMTALTQFGFTFDSSSVPGDFFNGSSWEGDNLHRYVKMLWPEIHSNSLPYYHSDNFIEVPNNLGAIDYWGDVEALVEKVLTVTDRQNYHCAVVTAHQETATEHFDKLEKFVDALLNVSEIVDLQFVTNQKLRKARLH